MIKQGVFLLLRLSVMAFHIAHTQPSVVALCDQHCPGSSPNFQLPFPYGFSEGCPIRLNCSKGEVFVGEEFRVQNVTSDGLLVNIPPKCNRSIETLKYMYSSNYALTSRNGLLLQNCTTKPQDCLIPEFLLRLHFRSKDCEHPYCYSAQVGAELVKNGNGASFLSFVNISDTGCKFLYSSVAVVVNSSSMASLEFRTLHLSYWLNGGCNCSPNANCIEIISPVNQTEGYRCQCVEGYEGDGYAMGRGCLKAIDITEKIHSELKLIDQSPKREICYRYGIRMGNHRITKTVRPFLVQRFSKTKLKVTTNSQKRYDCKTGGNFTILVIRPEEDLEALRRTPLNQRMTGNIDERVATLSELKKLYGDDFNDRSMEQIYCSCKFGARKLEQLPGASIFVGRMKRNNSSRFALAKRTQESISF
ncbi:hypothetical protein MKW92_012462 [Papaver armeniacum]|nr:hypothetical protein MKW92_012462 [Papaver armeniacum]